MKKIYIILFIIIPVISFSQNTKYIVIDPGHQWDNTTGVLPTAKTITEVQTNLDVAQKLDELIGKDFWLNWEVR
jgi:N-acetylmuramoyl-L-alanine amidase